MSGDHGVAVHPSLLWAQRNDCLYITVSISDVKSQSVNVNDKSLEFRYYMAYLKLHFSEPRLVKTNRQTMKLNLTYMDKSAQRNLKLRLPAEKLSSASKRKNPEHGLVSFLSKPSVHG
uniref:CS domain-containing protein n=1 Tax=Schistosoma japonicum TaxID=6182 RepID=C1LXX5_SCHJA|nr:Conserved hypothetical protein [Schistosoma japonicum]